MHVATSFSVLVFYRRRVLTLTRGIVSGDTNAWRYAGKLGVATIPAVVAVLLFGDFPEAQFESARSAAIGLLVTGAVLWTTRRTVASAQALEPSWIAALLIGCAPAVAILPGISRSGSTVAAAEFSFMRVSWRSQTPPSGPRRCWLEMPVEAMGPMLAGGALARVSGVAAIWAFVRLLRSQGFH